MSNNTLEVIPINNVPKRGALALKDRDERRLCHALNGGLHGILGILLTAGAASLTEIILYSGPWIISTMYFVPIMTVLALLCVGGFVSIRGAVHHFGSYFKERDPRLCLPEGSSLEEAEEDAKLRKAVVEYNTLAQGWNDGNTEDCAAVRKTHHLSIVRVSANALSCCESIVHQKHSLHLPKNRLHRRPLSI